ncbi:MAG: metal-dependent hydrolase [Candidatus Diapherotrites archaeon]|nr:metal-dependent hydrolase [Candidatus Diapherotrites archaeon]
MAFTLFHGAIGYLFACLITKDKNLRRIGFIGGIIPDLDGLFLFTDFFFNTNYYPLFHRTLTHPILFGIFAAIITVIIMHKLFKTNKIKTFVVFLSGFLLHDAIDLLYNTTTTGWAIPLFAPLSTEKYSFPFIGTYTGVFNALCMIILIVT